MNKADLPELPSGMKWENWSDFWVAADPINGGGVTIDFTRRNFALGWTSIYKPKGDFSGRGWKEALVAAAVAALRESQA